MMREFGELTFLTSLGGRRVIRIPDPTVLITQDMVDIAESGILTANPFDETVGNLISLTNAQRVLVNRTSIF